MCGICGIIGSKAQPIDLTVVRQMNTRLVHRGPDGAGITYGSGFAFGHTRLAIIDKIGGKQPITSSDGRFTLTFNGEIYNYIELRHELISAGVEFKTLSDSEVLLHALGIWQERALDKINGMFAFAFHDAKDDTFLLGRDPFGIKPLYYVELPNGELIFASEIKALMAHPYLDAEEDWEAVEEYLHFQFALHDRTLFKNVKKLEPGCYLIRDNQRRWKIQRYWDPNFATAEDRSIEELNDEFDYLLNDSVRLQLRSDVPIGCYLSGGLDSSLISAIVAQQSSGQTKGFHGKFAEGPEFDESAYAHEVAKASGIDLQEVVPTAEDFVNDLPQLIYQMDEPVAGPGLFPQFQVCKLASQSVKVVLGGQGGDELFAGYSRYLVGYLEQALKGAIQGTNEEGNHLVSLSSIIPNLRMLENYVPMMKNFWADGLFGPMDARYFRLIDRSPNLIELLSPDVLDRFNGERVFGEFQRIFSHPDTKSYVNKMTHFDQKTLLPALLQVEDRVSMSVSIESRVPFLDRRISDLVSTMPAHHKFAGGQAKSTLKRVAANYIPNKIINRKDKMGFPVPFSEWMVKGPVREFIRDILLDRRSRERGLFRPEALDKLIGQEARFGRQIWGALCLELWMREFIDGDAFSAQLPEIDMEIVNVQSP